MVSSIYTYDNLEQVQYEYDLNDNLIKVTDREGSETTYTYDAINRITEIHRPNGISTYNTYKARNQITELVNVCDDCEWVVSNYSYTYDNRGFITAETAIESLAGYAYDDKHDGRHTDGRHDDLYPHGTGHNGKHDKDAAFAYQIVQTDRTFTNDDAGKLLSSTETEDNYGTYTYTYEYDLMGNRTYMEKTAEDGTIALWCKYEYNESNQLVKECSFEKGQTTMLTYTYDADGNRILETEKLCGRYGTVCASVTRYRYDVENRLAAVQEQGRLLMAAAYDGDGNRVFQLNYNPEKESTYRCGTTHGEHRTDTCHDGHGESQGDEWKKDTHNRYDILFPVDDRSDRDHRGLIYDIHNTGKHSDYELIEYINDVNREYTEVLVENSFGGRTDTSYIYGVDRLSFDYENGCSGYYLYDPRGSVTGITGEQGRLVRSYRYDAFGNLTFGEPKYDNEYTYNGESYNPNIESQYLRARYYDVVNGNFFTEDSYLGNINEPLTLNRYNYCVSSPVNYVDPSGNIPVFIVAGLVVAAVTTVGYGVYTGDWETAAVMGLTAGVGTATMGWATTALGLTTTGATLAGTMKATLISTAAASGTEKIGNAIIKGETYTPEEIATDIAMIPAEAMVDTLIGHGADKLTSFAARHLSQANWLPKFGSKGAATDIADTAADLVNQLDDSVSTTNTVDTIANQMDDAFGASSVPDCDLLPSSSTNGYYQDANGRWHRPNGQFASNAEVGIDAPTGVSDASGLDVMGGSNPTILALPEPKGTNPWMEGTEIIATSAPKDCYVNMALSPGQTKPGGWGTFDSIPDVNYVRNELAVIPEFKPEVGSVQRYLIPEGTPIQIGIVGPQKSGGKTYLGGGNQVQILNFEDRAKLVPIGVPYEIK